MCWLAAASLPAQEFSILSTNQDRTLTWTNPFATGSITIETATNPVVGPWLPSGHFFATGAVQSATPALPRPATAFYRLLAVDCSSVPTGMALIPGGAFLMGDNYAEGFTNALPAHVVNVSTFLIDQFEVTNEEMRRVLQWAYDRDLIHGDWSAVTNSEGDPCQLLNFVGNDHGIPFTHISFTNNVFTVADGRENHPATGVTWYGAQAYCNYRSDIEGLERCITFTNRLSQYISGWLCDTSKSGYRLPTEAEWEKAARGGLTGHHFPWDSYGGDYASHISRTNAHYGGGNTTVPVGSYQPNGYGLYDMAGNVWEWVWDYYKGDWYSQPEATENNTTGPSGPYTGTEWLMTKIIRSGSVGYYDGKYLICASRHSQGYGPRYANWVVGFRCARTP